MLSALTHWFSTFRNSPRAAEETQSVPAIKPAAPRHADVAGLRGIVQRAARLGDDTDVQVRGYASLAQLRSLMTSSDRPGVERSQSAVLILHEHFSGHLASLIRRRHSALQLRVVPLGTTLPGPESAADLSLASHRLGWRRIFWDSHPAVAVARLLETSVPGDQVFIYWPTWHPALADEFQGRN